MAVRTLTIECPMCKGEIVVDADTGEVLSHKEYKKEVKSFDDFLKEQSTRSSDLEAKFAAAKEVIAGIFGDVFFCRFICSSFFRGISGIERLGLFHEGFEFFVAHLRCRRSRNCLRGHPTGGRFFRRLNCIF